MNFIEKFPAENEKHQDGTGIPKTAQISRIVFQVGSDEIADSQPTLFESRFDEGNT